MSLITIVLRILHILSGVYWAGAVFVTVTFLFGAIADAGPGGGQVIGALIKRKYFNFLPAVAVVTVLSGLWLYYITSGHFDPAYMGSRMGKGIGAGAVAALVAFAFGVLIGRPATLGAVAARGKAMSLPDGPEKAQLIATSDALRARGQGAIKVAAAFLLIAVLAMASARYL